MSSVWWKVLCRLGMRKSSTCDYVQICVMRCWTQWCSWHVALLMATSLNIFKQVTQLKVFSLTEELIWKLKSVYKYLYILGYTFTSSYICSYLTRAVNMKTCCVALHPTLVFRCELDASSDMPWQILRVHVYLALHVDTDCTRFKPLRARFELI